MKKLRPQFCVTIMNMKMNIKLTRLLAVLFLLSLGKVSAQIVLSKDYQNNYSPAIGTFQGIQFREAGFSGLYAIPGSNGKEFWTVTDRGVNVDAANANLSGCRPTYDKIYGFPSYAPKLVRIRVNGDSIQILQIISMKRPNGTPASGIINPTGLGSTAAELASTDTVMNCSRFNLKLTAKDTWGIDAEGLVVDKDGFFWICEEGGPTIWKLNSNGVVVNRFTPYANMGGKQSTDIMIDSCFKYRKNNRGFEGIALTPSGKIYVMIQSPILFPNQTIGEGTRIHRILEIDPQTNATRMFAYLNDGIIGASGSNQIRLRDWKIGDMAAINDTTFLVLEAALRGTTDIKRMYQINISGATPVTSGLYGGKTLEALVDSTGLAANSIKPVSKKLFMDLLAQGWPATLEKAEGLAIINDSTLAICNDNDYGQVSLPQNGIATATPYTSHLLVYSLKGSNKLSNFKLTPTFEGYGKTGASSSKAPYLKSLQSGVQFTSIITAGDKVGSYTASGIPDGAGALDNGDGTFNFYVNHEIPGSGGVVRAHGQKGAFVSKWKINKSDLSVIQGSDLIQNVYVYSAGAYTLANAANPNAKAIFNRFCSADLPEVGAFFDKRTGLGTTERMFLNGEETGAEGRAFAHILTGSNQGTSYELPYLGKYSWENALACPSSGVKTVVVGTDDATPGQVYVYVGTKTNTGNEIEKAGLSNGKLYGVAVQGLTTEVSGSFPIANTKFTLVDLGIVKDSTGAGLNTKSNSLGVTNFLRPEDGAWDINNPKDFYFATTNNFTAPSRLWRLTFIDPTQPELGGTVTVVLDGTEGPKMIDNMAIDNTGLAYLQEDPGNQSYLSRIWQYNTKTDAIKPIAEHDGNRFLAGGSNYLTQDEESSGIIDAQSILGPGMFLLVDQAHHPMAAEVYEGGQFLAMYNAEAALNQPEISIAGNTIDIADETTAIATTNGTDFGRVSIGSAQNKTFTVKNTGVGALTIGGINFGGLSAADFSYTGTLPLIINAGNTADITVQFAPKAVGTRTASIHIFNNDLNENTFDFAIGAAGLPAGLTGSGTASSPYLVPLATGVSFTSILTAGESVNGYKLSGLGDGLGAYDNFNGTFTLLVNHEINNSLGVPRAHGQIGAYVSKWIINKSNLSPVSGSDLVKNVKIWTAGAYATYNTANPDAKAAFNRFCSADLPAPSAFYNSLSGLGTKERIFLNGEESGAEGRAFGHILTGTEAGTSYELPYLGKFSWENALASPAMGDKTIVVGTDDATPGQVYIYVGNKTNTGTDIEKAGLSNGKLFGVAVSGLPAEISGSIPAAATPFSMVDLGVVRDSSGAGLNTKSNSLNVTNFLRPEDGVWDPKNPRDFYFVTTNSFTAPSRLWRLRFNDALNPENGGNITVLLDGTEGPKMMDNMTIDNFGHILLQEDPGNQSYLAKIWQYDIETDKVVALAEHDQTRFVTGGSKFLTQDEESSGIIDMQAILGPGMFILVDQAHYSIPGEVVEGGQLLAMYNPTTFNSNPEIIVSGNNIEIQNGETRTDVQKNTNFETVILGNYVDKTISIKNEGFGPMVITGIGFTGTDAADFSAYGLPALPIKLAAGKSLQAMVRFQPAAEGIRNATLSILSNDFDESEFTFAVTGKATDPSTSTEDLTQGNESIKLFVNNSQGIAILNTEFNTTENLEIRVYNTQGVEVLSPVSTKVNVGKQTQTIDVSILADGIYYFVIETAESTEKIKVFITK